MDFEQLLSQYQNQNQTQDSDTKSTEEGGLKRGKKKVKRVENSEEKEEFNIRKSVLPVASKIEDPSGVPKDGLEYLLTVRQEESKLPNYKKSQVKVNNSSSSSSGIPTHYLTTLLKTNQFLQNNTFTSKNLPDIGWQSQLLEHFNLYKRSFHLNLNFQPKVFLNSGVLPFTVSSQRKTIWKPLSKKFLFNMSINQIEKSLTNVYTTCPISELECRWGFYLLMRLDDLLDGNFLFQLRELCRRTIRLRDQDLSKITETERVNHILFCNVVISIISLHFQQKDLNI